VADHENKIFNNLPMDVLRKTKSPVAEEFELEDSS